MIDHNFNNQRLQIILVLKHTSLENMSKMRHDS